MTLPVREDILREIHQRLTKVTQSGAAVTVLRNPKVPPKIRDLPAISILFEEDELANSDFGGDYPEHTCKWPIVVIPYMLGSDGTDETAEIEIHGYCDDVRRELWRNGSTLSNKCTYLYQAGWGLLIKPQLGEAGIGLPMNLVAVYTENLERLYENY